MCFSIDKKILRKEMKKRVACLDCATKQAKSKVIASLLEQNQHFKNASSILFFWPLPDEIDLSRWIEKWAKTKQVYLPVVQEDNLIICKYTEQKIKGTYNIMEPVNAEIANLSEIDLVIVPGLGFDDVTFARLGRGKGFYDKLLSNSTVYKIGICYSEQLCKSLPIELHDVKMNEVIFA